MPHLFSSKHSGQIWKPQVQFQQKGFSCLQQWQRNSFLRRRPRLPWSWSVMASVLVGGPQLPLHPVKIGGSAVDHRGGEDLRHLVGVQGADHPADLAKQVAA